MPAINLTDIRGVSEPLRQYNFELVIPSPPGGDGADSMRIRVASATIPGIQFETFETSYGGWVQKHAGRRMYTRTLAIEYVEDAKLTTYKFFKNWWEMQWDPETGAQQDETEYKVEALLRLYDHLKTLVGTFQMNGTMVEEIGDVTLDPAASDAVRVPVTLSYDDVTFLT